MRLVKDCLAALFQALAEIFDRLADACEEKTPVTTNGHVEPDRSTR